MTANLTKDREMQMDPFNILLVEDNATDALIVETKIEKMNEFRLQIVEQLSEAIECLDTKKVDVILLDLNLPDALGLEGLIKLRRETQSVPIVVLTGVDDEELGIMALQRGAQDYLVKGEGSHRLMLAIRYAIERMRINKIPPNRSTVLGIENVIKQKQYEVLTERELQVLKLLGKAYSNQEIAQHLVLSITTVKTHISNILHKLSVADRSKAIVEALRRGLI